MSQSGTYSAGSTPPVGGVNTLTGNTGGAVGPTAHNINIVGTGVVDVVGTPGTSTLTISLTSSGGTDQFDTDSGTAAPASGVIDIAGGLNINTSGATNVVTVNLDDTVSITGSFTAGTTSGFITAQTGDISITAGNLNLPTTLSSADEGVINIDGSPFIQNLAGNIIVGKGAANFTFNTSSAINNTIIGEGAFGDITTGDNNVVIGEDSLLAATSASQNVVIGASTGGGMTSGSGNIIVGSGSAANFLSTESNNIVIGSSASSTLQNTIIIGTQGSGSQQQDACFIAGINGITVSNQELVTINSVTGQLGVTSSDSVGTATFDADSGTASPVAGVIHIVGSTNIHTAASASTVEVILDDDVTISGDFTTTGGLFALPTTTSTAGQITLNSQPFLHAFDGNNIFAGANSGNFTMSSQFNVGIGTNSLSSLTASGGGQGANTAIGYNAGKSLTTGVANVLIGIQSGQNLTTLTNANGITAVGQSTLSTATSAGDTTAIGSAVLTSYTATTDPGNTAVGAGALNKLTTGTFNCVIGAAGFNAGTYTSNESGNLMIQNNGTVGDQNIIRIGTQGTGNGQQNTCFIAGITGATVTGSAVLCSTSGQLGTIASSERYKENIKPISNNRLLKLRPVEFNYKADSDKKVHYGLVAEEVEKVFPELVLYSEGKPETVAYHELYALFLDEIQILKKEIQELKLRK